MVIYHCITTYHLLEFIVHAMIFGKNREKLLLVPEFLANRTPNFDKLGQFFDEVKIFRYRIIPHNDLHIKKVKDVTNLLSLDYKKAEEIHVAGAQYYFSSLLIEENIPFYFWEESSGVLTKPEALRGIVKGINEYQHYITEKNGMYTGDNVCVKKIICNYLAQGEKFIPNDSTLDFNVVNLMNTLNADELMMLKSFFSVPCDISFKNNTAVILTQHFANLNMMSFDAQVYLYQSTIDYYLEEYNLCFKVHPDDLIYYSQLFDGSLVLREKFPSEFLPHISSIRPDVIAAVSSTGIRNISSKYDKILNFNMEYEKDYIKNHVYYCGFKVLENLFSAKDCIKMYFEGINTTQFLNMNFFSEFNFEIICVDVPKEADVCILDVGYEKYRSLHLDEFEGLIISFDPDFLYSLDAENYDEIIPILITKEKRAGNIYTNLDDEVVYVKTKIIDQRKAVRCMEYDKELFYSNIDTHVSELSDEKTQILVLKGILQATEKRLLYYINREKELLEQIEKNKS